MNYTHYAPYELDIGRKRLDERTKSVASRILKDSAFSNVGREVGRIQSSVLGQDNLAAIIELLQRKVNGFLGIASKKRDTLSADQAEKALRELDNLGDRVIDDIRSGLEK